MFRSSDVTMSIILVGTLASPALGQTVPPATGAATAQSAQPTTVEDIVVTAQRREERLQDVPIAITAITSARLASSGVTNAGELAVLTPALNAPATQNYFQPRIRGIGSQAFGPGLENPIATYIDGVYIAAAPASLLSLTDIERVEILKGPQGTLFGRNATGGLIQVITRDPKPGLGGSLDLGYGNYDAVAVDAYITGGSEKLSADLTLTNKYQGKGYGYNFARNEQTNRPAHDFGVRSKILFRPDDQTSVRLAGDYSASSGSFPTTRQWSGALPVLGAPTPGSPWDANNDYPSKNRFAGGGVSLRAERDLGTVRLVSITAYRASRYDYQLDYDTTPTPALTVTNTQQDRQFSQEVQLRSGSQSPISWLVGGYYFNAKGSFDPATVGFSGPVVNPMFPLTEIVFEGDQRSESGAAFAQTTVPLGTRVCLTAGLRYTTELRTLDTTETLVIANALRIPQAFAARKRFDKLTWRAALDYRIGPDLLAYASFNRGFKSGGFNVTTPDQPAFKPEQLDAYEVGVKPSCSIGSCG